MEKLKNLINPGSKKDDEVMYGSGRSDDPVHTGATNLGSSHTGSGQGSHFSSSRTAGHDPFSTSSISAETSQYDKGTSTGTSQFASGTTGGASHGLSEPYASRMPGGFDDDDAATTASVSSGVPGQSQSRSATTSANDEPLTDKPLPNEPVSGTGLGQSSLTGNRYPDRNVERSRGLGDYSDSSNLDRNAALEAGAIESGTYRHEDPQREHYAPETGRSFPLGGSSVTGGHGSTTTGPHSSSFANKADPRVDSDGSRSNAGYGSASASDSDNRATPSLGNQGSLNRDILDEGAGTGADVMGPGTTKSTHYGSEARQHGHQQHGHQYEGDPREAGEVRGLGGPHFVPGPHLTDTANRLDPHVDSGIAATGTTVASSGHHHHDRHGHRGEEAALASGAGAAGLEALDAERSKQGTKSHNTSSGYNPSQTDRRGTEITESGAYDHDRDTTAPVSSTGKTAGPHRSNIMNKLDPRVDSDLSKQQDSHSGEHYAREAAMAGVGSTGLYEAEKHHHSNESNLAASSTISGIGRFQDRDHQVGRDVALTGFGRAGLSEVHEHHRGNEPSLAMSSATSGMGSQRPYGSNVDPRSDSRRFNMARDEAAVSAAGSGHQLATSSDHHHKKDAGLAGAGGIGAYEAERNFGPSNRHDLAATPQDQLAGSGQQPAVATSSSPYPSSNFGDGSQLHRGHRTVHNPLATGVGAGTIDGVDKTQKAEDYGHTGPGTQEREHQRPETSFAAYPSPGRGNDTGNDNHRGYHTDRDDALLGAAGAGALADHEFSQKDATNHGNVPYEGISRQHHTGRDTAAVGSAGAGADALLGHEYSQRDPASYDNEPYRKTSQGRRTGRDAAISSGAAGAGGVAEHENSRKDVEKLQKAHAKEEKALEKEHSKEVKHHNKDLEKEEKAHEKTIEKAEKRHEKAMEKDEKEHAKAVEKDERKQEHGEKKHGGLLGFLHRDKPDKDLKEDEARRQAATRTDRGEEEMAAGENATGVDPRQDCDPLQGEHGSQSGVHDRPIGIGSGPTTHDAYGAHDSGHNKLHKDPPAKIVESRGYEFQ